MSGHSKWSTIKHKKAAKDAKRGKLFTKLIKEITVAARMGGGEIDSNPRLRTAVTAAKAQSMPHENIDRAIKKGTGELEGTSYEDVVYEGYGPGGVAILAIALTDNRNRTVAEIRRVFSKNGGNMGAAGCVAWMFSRRGTITVDKSAVEEDRLIEVALDAGADDVGDDGDSFSVTTPPDKFDAVKEALDRAGIACAGAEVGMVPKDTVQLAGEEAQKAMRLVEELEDHDDIQAVSSNFDISPEELEKLSA